VLPHQGKKADRTAKSLLSTQRRFQVRQVDDFAGTARWRFI